MPVLEVDGKTISQSMAIARFLARRYKLAGKTDLEEAEADAIVDFMSDCFNGKYLSRIYFMRYLQEIYIIVYRRK